MMHFYPPYPAAAGVEVVGVKRKTSRAERRVGIRLQAGPGGNRGAGCGRCVLMEIIAASAAIISRKRKSFLAIFPVFQSKMTGMETAYLQMDC